MKKLSAYLDEAVAAEAARAARQHGVSLSAWLNAAAERGLLVEKRRDAIAERWAGDAFFEDPVLWAESVLQRPTSRFRAPCAPKKRKLSASLDEVVAADVALVAKQHGVSLSAWLNAAAERELTIERGRAGVAEWEAEHGPFTDEEIAWAESVLQRAGVAIRDRQ